MLYSIFIEKHVLKFLSKLEKSISKRLLEKIEKLRENPLPSDAKRVVNMKDTVFRIRIGQYRVLYRIEGSSLIIVFLIDKRSRVYNKWFTIIFRLLYK